MGVVLVFLKSYFLFIHLVWMQIADLPLAVLLLLLAVAGLAVLGGATLFARLASRYRWRWPGLWIALGCFVLFGVLTAVVVFTPAAPVAPLIFLPFIVLGAIHAVRRWPRGAAGAPARRRLAIVLVCVLVFLFDLKNFALQADVRSLERQFDTATFEIKAVKSGAAVAPLLDFGTISSTLVEQLLGFRTSFHRVAPPIVVARLTRGGTAPAAAYLAMVDLKAPGIRILITPERGPKRLTSQFAEETGAVVAINGEAGDSPAENAELKEWTDNWIVRGKPILLEDSADRPFLSFDAHNHGKYFPAAIVDREPTPEKYNTIWGRWDLLVDGQPRRAQGYIPRARTAMGLDATGDRLYLLQVDGDQASYSLGMTMSDVGRLLSAFGAVNVMACDEGGSAAMYVRSQDGIVGRPADGQERPIYTHFGVGYSPEEASAG